MEKIQFTNFLNKNNLYLDDDGTGIFLSSTTHKSSVIEDARGDIIKVNNKNIEKSVIHMIGLINSVDELHVEVLKNGLVYTAEKIDLSNQKIYYTKEDIFRIILKRI